jgi:hypothetical protein
MSAKTDETLKTEACNISVQPLQHMYIPTYFCNIHMKTIVTYL